MTQNVNETIIANISNLTNGLPYEAKTIRISLINRLGSSIKSDRKAFVCKAKVCVVTGGPGPGLGIGIGVAVSILVVSVVIISFLVYRKYIIN